MSPRGESTTNQGMPKVAGKCITAVKRNSEGDILQFQLETGEVLNYEQVLSYVSEGNSEGLLTQANQVGDMILRSYPDGRDDNNLDNLPTFN